MATRGRHFEHYGRPGRGRHGRGEEKTGSIRDLLEVKKRFLSDPDSLKQALDNLARNEPGLKNAVDTIQHQVFLPKLAIRAIIDQLNLIAVTREMHRLGHIPTEPAGSIDVRAKTVAGRDVHIRVVKERGEWRLHISYGRRLAE